MKKNKKAVSEIVSTVLIIMIAVAAVGILSAIIFPMVRDNLTSQNVCSLATTDLYLDSSSGITCLESNEGILVIRINKGAEDIEYYGVRISISVEGNSYSRIQRSSFENSATVFNYNVTNFLSEGSIDYIELYPIVRVGDSQLQCERGSTVILPSCSLSQSRIQQIKDGGNFPVFEESAFDDSDDSPEGPGGYPEN